VKPVPENIVSTVIDGVVLFVTSSVFWLAVAGWLVILTPVILRRKFSAKKKLTEIMNNLVPVGSPASPGTLLPVAIDYPAALALRQMALVQDELPKYLLAPEVSALLHYVPDLHRKMLLATLWNTGARINEALALTRGIFRWRRRIRSCSWPRSSSAPRKRPGRQVVLPQAVRSIVWFRFPITTMSASCR
jgi:integrase